MLIWMTTWHYLTHPPHSLAVLSLNFQDIELFPNNRATTMALEDTPNKLRAPPLHHQMVLPEPSRDPDRHLRHRIKKTESSWTHFKYYFTLKELLIFFFLIPTFMHNPFSVATSSGNFHNAGFFFPPWSNP